MPPQPSSFHHKFLVTIRGEAGVILRFISREKNPGVNLVSAGLRAEVVELAAVLYKIDPDHFLAFLSGRPGWRQEVTGRAWIFHHDDLKEPLRIEPDRDRKAWGKEDWPTAVWRLIVQLAELELLSDVQIIGLLVEPFADVLTPVPTSEVREKVKQSQLRRNLLRQLPSFDVLKIFWSAFHAVTEDDFYRVLRKYGLTNDYIQGCWVPFLNSPLGYMFTRSPDTQGRVLLAEIVRHVDLAKLERAISIPAKEEVTDG